MKMIFINSVPSIYYPPHPHSYKTPPKNITLKSAISRKFVTSSALQPYLGIDRQADRQSAQLKM